MKISLDTYFISFSIERKYCVQLSLFVRTLRKANSSRPQRSRKWFLRLSIYYLADTLSFKLASFYQNIAYYGLSSLENCKYQVVFTALAIEERGILIVVVCRRDCMCVTRRRPTDITSRTLGHSVFLWGTPPEYFRTRQTFHRFTVQGFCLAWQRVVYCRTWRCMILSMRANIKAIEVATLKLSRFILPSSNKLAVFFMNCKSVDRSTHLATSLLQENCHASTFIHALKITNFCLSFYRF